MTTDIVSSVKRRQMMQAVRRHGTDIEIAVRLAVTRLGDHSRANAATLPVSGRQKASCRRARAFSVEQPVAGCGAASCRFLPAASCRRGDLLAATRVYPSLPSSRLSRSPMSLGTRKTNCFPFFFSSKTPRLARSSRSVRAV